MNKTHNHWQTPKEIYEELNKEFKFTYDPCPIHSQINSLYIEWGSSNFVNPPYDKKNKEKFIKKSIIEWQKGKTIVLLLPVSTSTKIFHDLILPNAEIRFIKGRLKFHEITKNKRTLTNARHDSMIVILK